MKTQLPGAFNVTLSFLSCSQLPKGQADFLHTITWGTKLRSANGQDIMATFCANGRVKSENQLRVKVNTDHETMTKLNRMAVMSTINQTNNNK